MCWHKRKKESIAFIYLFVLTQNFGEMDNILFMVVDTGGCIVKCSKRGHIPIQQIGEYCQDEICCWQVLRITRNYVPVSICNLLWTCSGLPKITTILYFLRFRVITRSRSHSTTINNILFFLYHTTTHSNQSTTLHTYTHPYKLSFRINE